MDCNGVDDLLLSSQASLILSFKRLSVTYISNSPSFLISSVSLRSSDLLVPITNISIFSRSTPPS